MDSSHLKILYSLQIGLDSFHDKIVLLLLKIDSRLMEETIEPVTASNSNYITKLNKNK